MNKINLGDKVKDAITGFTGIAMARTIWITGCDRILVQPEGLTKEGKKYETDTFDEGTLIVLKKKKAPVSDKTKGGPRPSPTQKKSITK